MTRRLYGGLALTVSAMVLVGCPKNEPVAVPPGPAEKPDYDKLPAGLDPDLREIPADNPITHEKVVLGKHLYFDKRLSADDTIACATCHHPDKGWTDQAAVSTGIEGQTGGRSAPTVINRVFSKAQFWDGRAASLEEQAKGPITNPIEMGMADHDTTVKKIAAIAGYKPLFKAAFGDETVDIDRIAKAIATFERTIVSGDSPFDKYQAGDKTAMNESAVRGLDLFKNKARCSVCHAGLNFTDEKYHNLGVGYGKDQGRMDFTKNEADNGQFRTPTLRNIVDTAPYMHDGSEATLMDVVEFYDKGGEKNPHLDKEMKPLELTDQEKNDLVEFMKALSGTVTPVTEPAPVQ